MAFARSATSDLAFVLNDGTGMIPAEPTAVGISDQPTALAVGDLDGNDLSDVVVAHAGVDPSLTVLLADGGGFSTSNAFSAVGLVPLDVGLGRFDADEHLDAIAVGGTRLSVWAGDGSGGLVAAGDVDLPAESARLALGDVDADGALDVVVLHAASAAATILLGDGDGGWEAVQTPTCAGPAAVATGDLDVDGDDDFAIACDGDDALELLLWDADAGQFETETRALAPGADPRAIVIVDLDGDSAPDVLAGLDGGGLALLVADP
jgi:hypothetical protein